MAWIGGLRGTGWLMGGGMLLLGAFAPPTSLPKTTQPTFSGNVLPLVKKYCYTCHSGPDATAGLDLSAFKTADDALRASDRWTKVSKYIASGQMPPKGQPAPTAAERKAAQQAIDSLLGVGSDPAHVTLRRLNRFEYNNTIRDLVGVDFHPADDFPADDVGYGFDDIGDVLSISPLLMEKYLRAAQTIAVKAIIAPEDRVSHYPAQLLRFGQGAGMFEDGLMLTSNCTVYADHTFTRAGHYKIRVTCYGQQAGPEPVRMSVTCRGQKLLETDLTATAATPMTLDLPLDAAEGPTSIGVSFLNDYYNPQAPNPKDRDRNMIVQMIEVAGPLEGGEAPLSQKHLIPPGSGVSDLRSILGRIASQAYRRPVRPEELNRLVTLSKRAVDGGESFERAVQLGLTAILTSPNFIFRVEQPGPLTGYEIATRLSYFLWGTMPDDDLATLASNGQLVKPAILSQQIDRMLKDSKAAALADGFAAQWLELRKLQTITLDPKTFPDFSLALRTDMARETRAFFTHVVQEDRPVTDFIDADYGFVDERLANLYGMTGVTGDQMRMVKMPPDRQAGLLSEASFLTVTSNPTRTSPVKRGKFVLENILGTPPPPPPPNVGDLGDSAKVLDAKTLRQRMEAHRAKPECAVCHAKLDPIGFSLENFDALGRWRTDDQGAKIDCEGVLPDGTKFSGLDGLKKILVSRKDEFVHCLAEKLMTYALGRGLTAGDDPVIDRAVANAKANGYRFSALIHSIVLSPPFTMRTPNN